MLKANNFFVGKLQLFCEIAGLFFLIVVYCK